MTVPNALILPGLENYEGDHHHANIIVVNHDDGSGELETPLPAVEVCGTHGTRGSWGSIASAVPNLMREGNNNKCTS